MLRLNPPWKTSVSEATVLRTAKGSAIIEGKGSFCLSVEELRRAQTHADFILLSI